MMKAYIVDDEPLARDELAHILRRSKRVEIAGEAECVEDALEDIRRVKPDVVFLDIQLAEDSGLDLARQLLELDYRPEIVFATAYDEYALKAFELNAMDYILKPFDEARIHRTVDKLLRLHTNRDTVHTARADNKPAQKERTEKLALLVDERILLVHVSKIMYISSLEGKTIIATEEQQYKVNEPLVTYEQKLANTKIVRVHRAFLVNLDAIVEIEPWFHSTYNLLMKDGSKVPVSRTYLKELKQLIGF
ncbi:LytR/AlgR family response regulator transcription factor [Paenibacillus sp. MBLB4367]|uniref:LytR/AlgR family response regulator transcription factor n=1 Tax=Paenibacillus sp. MBLB4367 TaxID=3384767 RepID=UPI0039083E33